MSWLSLALSMNNFLLLCPWSVQSPAAEVSFPSCWHGHIAPVECPHCVSILIFLLVAIIFCLFLLLCSFTILCAECLLSCCLVARLLCCSSPSGPFWLVLSVPCFSFPTWVAWGFNLSGERHMPWCPNLQSTYLALDVFSVEPQLDTFIMVILHRGEGYLTKSGLSWRTGWPAGNSHYTKLSNDYRKKEWCFRWDCSIVLLYKADSSYMADQSLPKSTLSRSR